MAILTLLRHGRTAANAAGLIQGRIDNPLDEYGEAQAAAAAAAIGPVDRVVSSPLLRARQTAEFFSTSHEVDDRWIELDYGAWDGLAMAGLPADTWPTWRRNMDLRPPGGETLTEVGIRARAALDSIVGQELPEHTVVVSHVSPIKAAVAWALGMEDHVGWRIRLSTGSFTQVIVGEDFGPTLLSFNVVPPADT